VNILRHAARARLWALALGFVCGVAGTAGAQLPSAEDRLKILTDPESIKEKVEKDKTRPPLEFFRSQVAPFDILPFVKPNHWSTLTLEMRANYDDYSGLLQTEPVPLRDMPHMMLYRRESRLPKGQRMRFGMQLMLPQVPRELNVELVRPDGVRADEIWKASLRTLDPRQMLVVVLTRGANDAYASWNRFQAFVPASVDANDPNFAERQRYYRLVLPLEPERPPLSPHPLTWTTISHVVWDGMPPEALSSSQQQAMLDWLHWGGQLILVGGATPAYTLLRDSFLEPYLPADPAGEGVLLGEGELKGLSAAYPPPMHFGDPGDVEALPTTEEEARERYGRRYHAPETIRPAPNRPVYVTGLRPREGASVIPLDDASGRMLGVEWRAGRGRVLMLSVNPTDAGLATWPGLDTLVRRVVLRRPEEPLVRSYRESFQGVNPPLFGQLGGQSLSWFRLLSRDFNTEAAMAAAAAARPDFRRRDGGPGPRDGNDSSNPPAGGLGGAGLAPFLPRLRAELGGGLGRHHGAAAALPRRAGAGLGDHDPERDVRAQGHPRLPRRAGAAELADLPVPAGPPRVGVDRRAAAGAGVRRRRRAGRGVRHGL
jgi:hypothetical protein